MNGSEFPASIPERNAPNTSESLTEVAASALDASSISGASFAETASVAPSTALAGCVDSTILIETVSGAGSAAFGSGGSKGTGGGAIGLGRMRGNSVSIAMP
ncbi:MAG TPA: hypothetical protein VJS43_03980 [Candidatus Acidoferrales bacterium]|nr:hypothetical protein [Candidatus Acidoferrales bacterium]